MLWRRCRILLKRLVEHRFKNYPTMATGHAQPAADWVLLTKDY